MILEKLSPITQRFIVGGINTAIVFIMIFFSYTPMWNLLTPLIAGLVAGLAVKEYFHIATLKGMLPKTIIGVILTVLYVFALFICRQTPFFEILPLFFLAVSLVTVLTAHLRHGQDSVTNTAITLFGLVYIALPVGCILQINYFFPNDSLQDGRWWIFYLLAITYLTDSCGLFVGKSLGRHKLAPKISPNKTWEGAIGGFIIPIAFSLLIAYFANRAEFRIPIQLSYFESILLGSMLSILAQLGDLAESLLKRDVGVKDSSNIPGLGGMLDMIDSLVFTAPFLYFYLKYQNL